MEWRGGMIPHVGLSKDIPTDRQTIVNDRVPCGTLLQWNQYRGPTGTDIFPEQGVALNWQNKPSLLWKVPAGPGHSSVLIANKLCTRSNKAETRETLICTQPFKRKGKMEGSPANQVG